MNEIRVALRWDGQRVVGAAVRARGEIDMATVLAGREPGEAAALVPRLFSVCASAQAAAASTALASAAGEEPACAAAARAVGLEIVHEHLWRLMIDWPAVMGEASAYEAFLPARRALVAARDGDVHGCRRALCVASRVAETDVFGMLPAQWARLQGVDALREWAQSAATGPAGLLGRMWREQPGLGRSDVGLMPAGPDALRAALPGILARAAVQWRGQPAETGALSRLQHRPLIAGLLAAEGATAQARLAARLLELALMLDPGADAAGADVQALPIDRGDGVAAVQTARGLLLHRARLDGGRVCDYRIVAPTDWNFAVDGPLACGLEGLQGNDEGSLEQNARLAVMALDPCVACRVEIGHA